ncbi:MAG: phage tail family protein, partial [Candidatus Methanoperedens sp.]|nr:phage tail family protein [Candidatus Methanoperedens sp.]
TITWIGNITDEITYLRFRKELFGPGSKILKLNPNRLLNITGLKAEDNLDMKDASKTNFTLTLFAADPLEYSVLESTAQITVIGQGDQITVTNNGEAPTIPEWEITAIDLILNPSIIDQDGNTLGWTGIVDAGDVLVFRRDGTVTLNGINTGSTTGSVLRLLSGSIAITFNDDVNSSHSCTLKATWRDAFY